MKRYPIIIFLLSVLGVLPCHAETEPQIVISANGQPQQSIVLTRDTEIVIDTESELGPQFVINGSYRGTEITFKFDEAGIQEIVNDTTDQVKYIYANNILTITGFDGMVDMYDINGIKVLTHTATEPIDISALRAGIYVMNVNGNPIKIYKK